MEEIQEKLEIICNFQINYLFHILQKNENKLGYFKTELIKAISPQFFNDKERTSALISLCSILNTLLPESQPNKNVYKSFEKLLNSINLDNWIILYVFFELNLIKDLGFDTNLNKFKEEIFNSNIIKIKIDQKIMRYQFF